jgi:hypothetical protein
MNRMHQLKTVLGVFALLVASLLFASCKSRVEKEISGQVFTTNPKTGVVKQPGVMIHFLTEAQNEQFLQRVGEWRSNSIAVIQKAENDKARITAQIASSGLSRTPGVFTGAYYRIPVLQAYTNRLAQAGDFITAFQELCKERPSLLENLEVAELYYSFVLHELFYEIDNVKTQLPPFDDSSVKSFLKELRSVSTDADGDFSAVLTLGQEYWILAKSENNRTWYFRYVPDGTRLVLSDGNAE